MANKTPYRVADQQLTTQQAADEIGVWDGTIRKWIKEGKLKAIRLGHRAGFRISRTEWENFKKSREVAAGIDAQGE